MAAHRYTLCLVTCRHMCILSRPCSAEERKSIIYSPRCHFRCVLVSFFSWTQPELYQIFYPGFVMPLNAVHIFEATKSTSTHDKCLLKRKKCHWEKSIHILIIYFLNYLVNKTQLYIELNRNANYRLVKL